jgi:FkbM family methyltransferase
MNPLQCMLNFAVPLEGVIHVGANHGREYAGYARSTPGLILFLEAIPHLVAEIAGNLDPARPHFVRQAIAGADAGRTVTFNIASNDGRSSSYLDLGRHGVLRPEVKFVETFSGQIERLDGIIAAEHAGQDFNFLAIDTQGADLDVLRGSTGILDRIDAIYVEISNEALYEGGCTFLQIHQFLDDAGHVLRHVELNREGWGNAFFSRRRTRLHDFSDRNLARGRLCTQSSTFSYHTADRGVNGDLDQAFNIHSAVADPAPWWQVDLGEMTDISRILFVDRMGLEARAAELQIAVSRDGVTWRKAYDRKGRNLNGLVDLRWKGKARHVRLSLPGPGPLHFRQLIILP